MTAPGDSGGPVVNSSGSAHARNARRLVHASRKEDRRLSAALLAAALAHTPEAEEALRGARTRMARKPAALARELLRNFPKGRRSSKRRRRKSGAANADNGDAAVATETLETQDEQSEDGREDESDERDTSSNDDNVEDLDLEAADDAEEAA